MKKLFLLLAFPMTAFALTESQLADYKNDYTVAAAACLESSYLQECYKTDTKNCVEQAQKSYSGCFKFLQKRAGQKTTPEKFEQTLESCMLRDIDIQWKESVTKRSPACALPAKEAL